MSGRPTVNRASSYSGDYRPVQPSSLRQSHRPSSRSRPSSNETPPEGIFASESTPLVPNQGSSSHCYAHAGPCRHGTFSPRPESPTGEPLFLRHPDSDGSSTPGSGTRIPVLDSAITSIVGHDDWKKWLKKRIRTKKMGQSSELAAEAGIRDTPLMYMSYYVPCLTWLRQYKLSFIKGDLVSAVTMASFYLPMALSYASNLAHVPPIHGLYAFVFNPLLYAVFGSCPQMVVGPEAAGSLLVGTAVKSSVDSGHGKEDNDILHAQICGVVTGMAGAMVLIAGLVRLGFMDSVLSRPFLRGFISAIGFVITIDQLIPELGLADLADSKGVSHGSSADKIAFIIENAEKAHKATFLVALVSFIIIMVGR